MRNSKRSTVQYILNISSNNMRNPFVSFRLPEIYYSQSDTHHINDIVYRGMRQMEFHIIAWAHIKEAIPNKHFLTDLCLMKRLISYIVVQLYR